MNKFSDLLLRAGTAIVGAAIILFCCAYNEWTVLFMAMIIMIFSIREFVRLADLPKALIIWSYVVSIIICTLFFAIAFDHLDSEFIYLLLPLSFIGLFVQLFQKLL